jgi:carbonic anhydrase
MLGSTAACGCRLCAATGIAAVSRRRILAACGGALLAASTGRRAMAQATVSPDDALNRLMDGNRRYMAKQLSSFAEELDILRQNTVAKQEPFAAVLSCADSRVPVWNWCSIRPWVTSSSPGSPATSARQRS